MLADVAVDDFVGDQEGGKGCVVSSGRKSDS